MSSIAVSFSVEFNFTGVPAIVLTASTTIPDVDKPNLTGYFAITQPDGITTEGTHTSIAWDGSGYPSYSVPLRVGSDQLYQKGTYTIVFYAACTGYDDTTFTRSWDMEYLPVTQVIEDGFDCFTPELLYVDTTNYGVGGYSITGVTSAWSATSAAGNPTGTGSIFDLAIGGNYYDSSYRISYTKTIDYLNTSYSWLTVKEKISSRVTKKAFIPVSMATMLTYLIAIKTQRDAAKTNCQTYEDLDEIFEDANSLYQLMRVRVCAQNTVGLQDTFEEFYSLTHNSQTFTYINTNGLIPAYDFATGCSGSASSVQRYAMRATVGVSSFTAGIPDTATIKTVVRSGLSKGITAGVTADTEYLQIVGNVITLPTGDVIIPVTLPDGSVVGELFIFTYTP